MADHIGKIPVVFVNPDDTPLVRGGAEERRKFFDNLLSQSSPTYLKALLLQNRLLQQRNAHLTILAERRSTDTTLLDTYDEPLLETFQTLSQLRANCLVAFLAPFRKYYAQLSQGKEEPDIRYESQLLDLDFPKAFYQSRARDSAAGRTLLGAHRDEFGLLMGEEPVRKVGSQGQQKTFLLALKLAMSDYLAEFTGRQPLLLLDDIFERLDETRIAGLLALVKSGKLGQVFVTEATGERMRRVVEHAGLGEDSGWISL
jgi:DNA replication and repair protein RecF